MKTLQITFASLIVMLCLSFLPAQVQADQFKLDPAATYLRLSSDGAPNASPIDLFNLSFSVSAGQTLLIERLGDYMPYSGFGDINRSMIGVFSSSSDLLSSDNLNRVSGAIEYGIDFQTDPTHFGSLSTDITQDFLISDPDGSVSSLLVQVPIGARYLFITVKDSLFNDNTDPDDDFYISITSAVPVPSTISLLAIGLLGFTGISRQKNRG